MDSSTNQNITKKYRQQGWNHDKDLKYRKLKPFNDEFNNDNPVKNIGEKSIPPDQKNIYDWTVKFTIGYGDGKKTYSWIVQASSKKKVSKVFKKMVNQKQKNIRKELLGDLYNEYGYRSSWLISSVFISDFNTFDEHKQKLIKQFKKKYNEWKGFPPVYLPKILNITKNKK